MFFGHLLANFSICFRQHLFVLSLLKQLLLLITWSRELDCGDHQNERSRRQPVLLLISLLRNYRWYSNWRGVVQSQPVARWGCVMEIGHWLILPLVFAPEPAEVAGTHQSFLKHFCSLKRITLRTNWFTLWTAHHLLHNFRCLLFWLTGQVTCLSVRGDSQLTKMDKQICVVNGTEKGTNIRWQLDKNNCPIRLWILLV